MFGVAPRVTSIPSLNLNDRRSPKPFAGFPPFKLPPWAWKSKVGSLAWHPGFLMFGLAPRVNSIPYLNLNDRCFPKPFEGSPTLGFPMCLAILAKPPQGRHAIAKPDF